MIALWRDTFVQDVLHKRRLYLEHTAGLYVPSPFPFTLHPP